MKITTLIIGLFLSMGAFADTDETKSQDANDAGAAETCIVKGKIVDKSTGDALAGVTVCLENGDEVYTDFDGNFAFTGLQPGAYEIQTSLISYEKVTFTNVVIKPDAEKRLNIALRNLGE
ncbi:MAG: carboxypeptidase-like regulatory domain-containing protein [Bacteroidota bacterium]